MSEWISVKERRPLAGEMVLGLRKSGKVEIYRYDRESEYPWRDQFGAGDGPSVTHWTSLPEPPKQG